MHDDDPRSPSVTHGTPADGPLSSSGWVPARRDRAEVDHWSTPSGPPAVREVTGTVVHLDDGWTKPTESAIEIGTPTNRATATVIRGLPLLVLAVPAAWGLTWAVGGGWAVGLLFFAALGVLAYLFIVWADLVHNSPASTERHRINQAAKLKSMELKQTHELKRAIVESYLDHLEGKRHD